MSSHPTSAMVSRIVIVVELILRHLIARSCVRRIIRPVFEWLWLLDVLGVASPYVGAPAARGDCFILERSWRWVWRLVIEVVHLVILAEASSAAEDVDVKKESGEG